MGYKIGMLNVYRNMRLQYNYEVKDYENDRQNKKCTKEVLEIKLESQWTKQIEL